MQEIHYILNLPYKYYCMLYTVHDAAYMQQCQIPCSISHAQVTVSDRNSVSVSSPLYQAQVCERDQSVLANLELYTAYCHHQCIFLKGLKFECDNSS